MGEEAPPAETPAIGLMSGRGIAIILAVMLGGGSLGTFIPSSSDVGRASRRMDAEQAAQAAQLAAIEARVEGIGDDVKTLLQLHLESGK